MAETHRQNHKATAMKVPEFLREPLEAAQARLEAFEGEAQRVFKDLMQRGKASRKDFAELVRRLQKSELVSRLQKQGHLPELKDRLEKLRETGMERAHEWRGKAETFRAEALERLVEMQGKAVNFLGVASREQVEELSRELEKLIRRLEKGRRRSKKAGKPVSPEQV